MRRQYATIKQFDYSTKEEFKKHKVEMENKGYRLVKDIFSGILDPGELGNDENWKYTASFIKTDMM